MLSFPGFILLDLYSDLKMKTAKRFARVTLPQTLVSFRFVWCLVLGPRLSAKSNWQMRFHTHTHTHTEVDIEGVHVTAENRAENGGGRTEWRTES